MADLNRKTIDLAVRDAEDVGRWDGERPIEDPVHRWLEALTWAGMQAEGNTNQFHADQFSLDQARRIAAYALLLLDSKLSEVPAREETP